MRTNKTNKKSLAVPVLPGTHLFDQCGIALAAAALAAAALVAAALVAAALVAAAATAGGGVGVGVGVGVAGTAALGEAAAAEAAPAVAASASLLVEVAPLEFSPKGRPVIGLIAGRLVADAAAAEAGA